MTVLLDTSVIIDVLRQRRGRRELLRSLLEQGYELACTAINVAEVYSGMRSEEAEATSEFIESLEFVAIGREAARRAGELRRDWQRKGRTLSLPDAFVAAVALNFNLALATDNVKDFPMPELKFLPLPAA
ncbi:MAG: type II toxin-antitoxin system VapC family toxin [Acidobacteriia bacterium]|nr:type II toxin-antitoxin system VapC family toxin [Terriglobia bacterium]